MMVRSRVALEELLQNRLQTTRVCEDPLNMQARADLFNLYAGKHHADDASLSSGGADRATIKREAQSPTTDQQSEDSGVDVSVSASAFGGGRLPGHKWKRPDDECPTAVKSSRTDAAVLSVNVAVQVSSAGAVAKAAAARGDQPFRPWSSSDESLSGASLRLLHDTRDMDGIRTLTQQLQKTPLTQRQKTPLTQRQKTPLTQRQKTAPPPEPQPLDLTNGGRSRVAPDRVAAAAGAAATVPVATAAATDRAAEDAVRAAVGRHGKNMSRARRIEANARERSRVHTISAAFDTLRATVPSYSRNQKLSKLSTIRIASAYILTLSRLLDLDYSAEQDEPSVDECVRNVTGIIHMEGKAKKRKDER